MYNTDTDPISDIFAYRYYYRGYDFPANFPPEGRVRTQHEPNIFTESVYAWYVNNKEMK